MVRTSPSYCSRLLSDSCTPLHPLRFHTLEIFFESVIAGNLFKLRFRRVSDHVKLAERD